MMRYPNSQGVSTPALLKANLSYLQSEDISLN